MDVSPDTLKNLTPLVAVCVIFAGLLAVLMRAFLTHLDTKDKRIADVVQHTQTILSSIEKELAGLSENSRQQSQILQRLLFQLPHDRNYDDDEPIERRTHQANS